jgi:hypothetical protein
MIKVGQDGFQLAFRIVGLRLQENGVKSVDFDAKGRARPVQNRVPMLCLESNKWWRIVLIKTMHRRYCARMSIGRAGLPYCVGVQELNDRRTHFSTSRSVNKYIDSSRGKGSLCNSRYIPL